MFAITACGVSEVNHHVKVEQMLVREPGRITVLARGHALHLMTAFACDLSDQSPGLAASQHQQPKRGASSIEHLRIDLGKELGV